MKGDKEIFEELEEDLNINEQVLNINTVENNVTVDKKIINGIKGMYERLTIQYFLIK